MKRNANYIFEKLTNRHHCKKAQVGVDITLSTVYQITSPGYLPAGKGRLTPPTYVEVLPYATEHNGMAWSLSEGAYAVEFNEGVIGLDPDETGYIIQRSSLNRVGVRIESSIFDPGFKTSRLGATMFVFNRITIEQNARVAQFTIETCEPANNLYNGQWQNRATQ